MWKQIETVTTKLGGRPGGLLVGWDRVQRICTSLVFALAMGTLLARSVQADEPAHLVKDISVGAGKTYSGIQLMTVAGGRVYFTATTSGYGGELWTSDGTPAGTAMIRDLVPGHIGGAPIHATQMTEMDGLLYFVAISDDTDTYTQLWKTDGTPGGTTLVTHLNPTGMSMTYHIRMPTNANGTLFFFCNDEHGEGVWKTDGTPEGTMFVKAFSKIGLGEYSPAGAVGVIGQSIYFAADDGISGMELWKSDGTPEGTVLVKDLNVGPDDGMELYLPIAVFGSDLYFWADDGTHGSELWKSDGTAAGTVLLRDIVEGSGASDPGYPWSMLDVAGTLFFVARTNGGFPIEPMMWKSDGTSGGTLSVGPVPFRTQLAKAGSQLFFVGCDPDNGCELWKSDGTENGTALVKNINASGSMLSSGESLGAAEMDGKLFFWAEDGVHGKELWKSDGTAAGTVLVKDLAPGATSGARGGLVAVNHTLYFAGIGEDEHEWLWRSDGTQEGTLQIKRIGSDESSSSSPDGLTPLNGELYFAASDASSGRELWSTDGTPGGTNMIRDSASGTVGSNPAGFTALGNLLLFAAGEEYTLDGREPWKTDGTDEGTAKLKDITYATTLYPGPTLRSSNPREFTRFGDEIYFVANEADASGQIVFVWPALWKSDGTTNGTVEVWGIYPGAVHASSPDYWAHPGPEPSQLTTCGDQLYFAAYDPPRSIGRELWKLDAQDPAPELVSEINPGAASASPSGLTCLNGMLYFAATDATHGRELWKSDGTAAGTVLVKDLRPGADGSDPQNLAVVGSTIFFVADDGANGQELWKTNGTSAGTVLVKDIWPGRGWSYARDFIDAGGVLLFAANDGSHGRELWRSDGTPAGTMLLKDISPGNFSSAPLALTALGSGYWAVFSASDGVAGRELWITDGTSAGTRLWQDIAPGAANSDPTSLTTIDGALYFVADDGVTGEELWTATVPVCYTLTVTHSGSGSDPVATPANSPGCPAGQYLAGASISLSAAPAAGWQVSSWTGTTNDASASAANSLTMPASNHTAGVTYSQTPPTCYTLSTTHTGSGSDPVATPANSPGCAAGQYVVGEALNLTATPDAGWQVSGWSGTANNNSGSTANSLTMPTGNHTVSVSYAPRATFASKVFLPLVQR